MRVVAVLVLAVLVAGACGAPGAPSPAGTIPVLGTENFYADLLAQVGGSRVHATSVLNDPNADPHAYEASPRAAAAVADAKLVIVNGLGYDDFMRKLLAASARPGRVVIDVQATLGLPSGANPHVWYDPKTMPAVAEAAAAALAKLDPAGADGYQARKRAYLDALRPIDERIAALKATYAGSPVAFTEAVARYQTDAIGLVVLTPDGFTKAIEQGIDPAPADVGVERDLLTARRVKALIYNSQVATPLTQEIRDLASRSSIPVVGYAETMPSGAKTFQDWQLAQLGDLATALGGR
ncbi:MAG: zinc ABC transporter substrate-binding protein [Chloroflexota bacterium]|nr:zinc ABC transporter substrate-binding protein [Chloroflexota bacterium]